MEHVSVTDPAALGHFVSDLTDPNARARASRLNQLTSEERAVLWGDLLTLLADGSWEGSRVPTLLPGTPEYRRLAARIQAVLAHDELPEMAATKEATLLGGLRDARSTIRRTAALLLGARRCRQAVSALIDLLHDEDMDVQNAAVLALGHIAEFAPDAFARAANAVAIDRLIGHFASVNVPLRHAARAALVAIGRPAIGRPATGPLTEALEAPDERARWEAARALREIANPSTAPALVRALEDSNGGVRWLAAEGLIALRSYAVVPLLRALVWRSDSVWLRQGARHVLRALARQGLEPLVAPVLTALQDVEPAIEAPVASSTVLRELGTA